MYYSCSISRTRGTTSVVAGVVVEKGNVVVVRSRKSGIIVDTMGHFRCTWSLMIGSSMYVCSKELQKHEVYWLKDGDKIVLRGREREGGEERGKEECCNIEHL